ncbi:glycosyltransferase family protein [Desulfopila aestuarii]|uniref:Glycosyl transferases group 1 n=1 Tax=Desulfopila aestuarii DSM 18488 TaxID=1121416 RepID=A0A1M7XVH2_9BACT|nr:glycosyltransferase [Desulfopila aestuarii]SHO42565.1 Glycosyl transferases group 1 [Desulfopila aestuarii DSM 18488]
MRKKIAFAVSKKKFRYGPIATAVKNTGLVDLIPMNKQHLFDNYELVIFFYNKLPMIYKKHSTPVVWWMNDLREAEELKNSADVNFDAIFLCQTEALQQYSDLFGVPSYYMPQCGIESSCLKGRKIDWDVVFLGSTENNEYHHDRAAILEALSRKFKVHLISGEKNTRDQVWLYNQTPFSLSISLPVAGYTSNRLYNILSSGGFALVRHYPEIEQMFENHKHLVWFHEPDEAAELMQYYSNNTDKCKEIRESGRRLYFQKHSARERILNMSDIISGMESTFRGFL